MNEQDQAPPGEPGYAGPAELTSDDTAVPVTVTLRGWFQPIDGRFHWHGRVAAAAAVDAAWPPGATVTLRTPYGEAPGRLSDRDPWGRYRISGTGRPPYDLAR